ncbi:MAG: S41 family peptidase [Dehalococcoidia bacterium]
MVPHGDDRWCGIHPGSTFDVDEIESRFRELTAAIEQLQQQRPTGWILDLQGNGGGDSRFADYFAFATGYTGLLYEWSARSGHDRYNVWPDQDWPFLKEPLVVLQDRDSASASEIIAEVLKQAGKATVIGETSAGAVRGAREHELGPGILQVTVVLMKIGPNLVELDGVGVEPDIAVGRRLRFSSSSAAIREDPMVQAALAYLAQPAPAPGAR